MDLIGGLSAAKIAIDIAKDLRSIDRSVDEATYKLKLAELSIALADAQLALSEAKVQIGELETELNAAKNGEICPKCRSGKLSLTKATGMSTGGLDRYGVEQWTFECNSETCDFSTMRVNDPQGLVPKFLSKR